MQQRMEWFKQEGAAIGFVAVVLLLGVPLMLAMPLTADPVLYDLQAACALEGGVLYRDIVEPNLPGIVWLHMLIRTTLGWSQTVLKSVDLLIVVAIVGLLIGWTRSLKTDGLSPARAASWLLAGLLFWFYFGTSEWCHCQRDTWMLLPALGAVWLRRRQLQRLNASTSSKTLFGWSFLEGVIWAAGFWIKPFIAVPAVAVILLGWAISRAGWHRCGLDLLGILLGGLFIGGLGTGWLVASGTWPHFWEMAIEWNPTYFEVGRERWTWERLFREQARFFPFSLAHLFAIPWALSQLGWTIYSRWQAWRVEWRGQTKSAALLDEKIGNAPVLLAGLYLGWLLQSFTLQHLFDYIHVPELLLAIAICGRFLPGLLRGAMKTAAKSVTTVEAIETTPTDSAPRHSAEAFRWTPGVVAFLLLAALTNPAFRGDRLAVWPLCWSEGSSPRVKTALQHFPLPEWTELEPALDYLRGLHLRDGELTVHNVYLVHAYEALALRPSTRFVYLDVLSRVFRSREQEIIAALDASGHRYVLSSLLENGMSLADCREPTSAAAPELPSQFPQTSLHEFPYNQELVFRQGQYVIHRVNRSAEPLNPRFAPLASAR